MNISIKKKKSRIFRERERWILWGGTSCARDKMGCLGRMGYQMPMCEPFNFCRHFFYFSFFFWVIYSNVKYYYSFTKMETSPPIEKESYLNDTLGLISFTVQFSLKISAPIIHILLYLRCANKFYWVYKELGS